MSNPWNTKHEFSLPTDILEYFKEWYLPVRQNKLKVLQNQKKNPFDLKVLEKIQKIYDDGYGFKLFAREMGISYTQCRRLFIVILGINVRTGQSVVTEPLRKGRSDRISGNKGPWYNWPANKPDLLKETNTGLQGYFKLPDGKYIWLRSSWEYVYVKWMIKNGIEFEYEPTTIKLPNGQSYVPDFRLKDGSYIEIKSKFCGNSRFYKPLMAITELNHKIVIIEDVTPYTDYSLQTERRKWKKERLKNLPE